MGKCKGRTSRRSRSYPRSSKEVKEGVTKQATQLPSKRQFKGEGYKERINLELASKLICDGTSLRSIATNFPVTYIKFHEGLKEFQRIVIRPGLDDKQTYALDQPDILTPCNSQKSFYSTSQYFGLDSDDLDNDVSDYLPEGLRNKD
jgi:hypothetical protein